MDLFSQQNNEGLVDLLRPTLGEWVYKFTSNQLDYIMRLNAKVAEERKSKVIYPDPDDVYRMYRLVAPQDVKVVILGQDPYHDGNATGVAFACKQTLSPSLKQILIALDNTYPNNTNSNYYPNLEYLTIQGVFLLNTSLTVGKGRPGSHSQIGYHSIIVHTLNSMPKGTIFMLWGSNAKAYNKYIKVADKFVLECEHPMAAEYDGRKWNCDNFIKANEHLKQQSIQWL